MNSLGQMQELQSARRRGVGQTPQSMWIIRWKTCWGVVSDSRIYSQVFCAIFDFPVAGRDHALHYTWRCWGAQRRDVRTDFGSAGTGQACSRAAFPEQTRRRFRKKARQLSSSRRSARIGSRTSGSADVPKRGFGTGPTRAHGRAERQVAKGGCLLAREYRFPSPGRSHAQAAALVRSGSRDGGALWARILLRPGQARPSNIGAARTSP